MNIYTRLLGAITICTFGIAACVTIADGKQGLRSNATLCREVAYELDISVGFGLLTEEQAQSIIERCYQLK